MQYLPSRALGSTSEHQLVVAERKATSVPDPYDETNS